MAVIDRPRNVEPPVLPPKKKKGRPNQYKIVFHPGTDGTCAGSFNILRKVFNLGRDQALEQLIDSTISRKETIYDGSMDVVKTKLRDARIAKKKYKEEFPRLKRVSFTLEPL